MAKIEEKVLMLARRRGVSIVFCPEECEVKRLCHVGGVNPIEQVTGESLAGNIGTAEGCQTKNIGGKSFICFHLREGEGAASATVILTGPAPDICSQHVRLMLQCLKMLRHAVTRAPSDEARQGIALDVVPGAGLVEKEVLRELDSLLLGGIDGTGADGAIRLGIQVLQKMVKEPIANLHRNLQSQRWHLLSQSSPNPNETVSSPSMASETLVLDLDKFRSRGRAPSLRGQSSQPHSSIQSVASPTRLGVIHPPQYHRSIYLNAAQVLHQLLGSGSSMAM
eukprot:CAMPEP_0198247890 /NCGR_PEP_ID=MMETSP1446-20131203/46705_1 /TAXON_ID=1461542 ORGANISM="Unidentified sp, Strain CCMP2111" /NCGR_SAMPLE_ID=MMETSP1446 /ASSEMBLY_ACC=CAM_ASM_001112 /LENGTH=279 /DNA_ID=CAMNT_0043932219 /DNA_START=94 /DNA_END=934 /DNA_ORIENTATION=-